jgi:hypothetical protein
MQRMKIRGYATLIVGLVIVPALTAAAQGNPANFDNGTQSQPGVAPLAGQPYSATKYERTVRTLPDGSQVTVTAEDSKVARDADGRVFLDFKEKCPQDSPAPPWCGTHQVILFDSAAPSITPWLWGANAGHGATVQRMTPQQLTAAMNAAKAKAQTGGPRCAAATVISESLGKQIIEGVPVTGTRKTTTIPAGCDSNEQSITTVREVWRSAELDLDMKVITKDPRNGETISELKDFSQSPDAGLFRPPDGYSITFSDRGSEFAELYLEQLVKAGVQ